MFDTVEKPNTQDSFGPAEFIGVGIVTIGLVLVWITKNEKTFAILNLVGWAIATMGRNIRELHAPIAFDSLLKPAPKSEPKIRFGLFFWLGCALLVAAFFFSMRPEIFAPLELAGMTSMLLRRFRRADH